MEAGNCDLGAGKSGPGKWLLRFTWAQDRGLGRCVKTPRQQQSSSLSGSDTRGWRRRFQTNFASGGSIPLHLQRVRVWRYSTGDRGGLLKTRQQGMAAPLPSSPDPLNGPPTPDFFFFSAAPCGLRDLAGCGFPDRPGMEPGTPAVEAQIPSHWTAREFPLPLSPPF